MRLRLSLVLLGAALGFGCHWFYARVSSPLVPVRLVQLTVRDAAVLIADHLVGRRARCHAPVSPGDGDTLDLLGDEHEHHVYAHVVRLCLRRVDELPCAVAARWSGAVNDAEIDAPADCRVVFGQQ